MEYSFIVSQKEKMGIRNFFSRMSISESVKLEDKIKPHQNVFLRIGSCSHTFVSRIEDWDKENIYISGISSREAGFIIPEPPQKVEIFFLFGNNYYKADAKFKETKEQPIYLWVLNRPKELKRHKDRRRYYRLENVVRTLTQEYPNIFQDYDEAVIKNIGAGGVLVISQKNFKVGSKIVIKLPGINKAEYLSQVVWKAETTKLNNWYYGMKFLNLDADGQDWLASYVSNKLAKEKGLGYH